MLLKMKKYVYLVLCSVFVSPVFAQPAGLDFSFGINGKVITSFPDREGNTNDRLLLLPDGKLLHAYFMMGQESRTELIRYHINGMLDPGFGNNGIASVPSTAAMGMPMMTDIALLPDGKFVMGMQGVETDETADFILGRIKADGQLDLSFGTNGYVRTNFPGRADYLKVLKVQPDGKILAAGLSTDLDNSVWAYAVARYLANGSPDPGFGTGGQLRIAFPSAYLRNEVSCLALQPDGKILLAGRSVTADRAFVTLARLNADGSLDGSFGTGGTMVTELSDISVRVIGAAIQPDGRIVLAVGFGDGPRSVLARFMADGSPDPSFGTAGMWISDPFSFVFTGMALLPDNKILSAGFTYEGESSAMLLACYTPEGQPLSDFGNNGFIRTEIADSSYATALVVQPDHKVVLAGSARKNGTRASVAARYFTGPLTVNEIEGMAHTALLYPNPTQGELTLSYTLTGPQTLQVELLDMNGKVETAFPNLNKPAGKYEEQLRLPENLSAGTYYILIRSDKGHTALPFIKR